MSTVTCHPYRTARVASVIEIDRNSAEWDAFERKLTKMAGVTPDNHVVYTVTTRDGSELHFWCTDSKVLVGTKLLEGRW